MIARERRQRRRLSARLARSRLVASALVLRAPLEPVVAWMCDLVGTTEFDFLYQKGCRAHLWGMHPRSRILRRTAGRVAPGSPRCGSLARLGLLATVVLGCALTAPAMARASAPEFAGTARLDVFATSDLFPGGDTREPDQGLRLGLAPEVTFHAGDHLRIKPWADLGIERHRVYPERDLVAYEFGVDLRRSNLRLRLFHGFGNDELYFPDPSGDAIVDRRNTGAEVRLEVVPGVRVHGGIEREEKAFDELHVERDDRRWSTRLGVERGQAKMFRTALTWFYRDTRSITDLYSYGQNVLRLDAEGALVARLHGAVRLEGGVRSYRTGDVFASNFSRQDNRWRVSTMLDHPIAGPLRVELGAQWRATGSTRNSKNSIVRGASLGLVVER